MVVDPNGSRSGVASKRHFMSVGDCILRYNDKSACADCQRVASCCVALNRAAQRPARVASPANNLKQPFKTRLSKVYQYCNKVKTLKGRQGFVLCGIDNRVLVSP